MIKLLKKTSFLIFVIALLTIKTGYAQQVSPAFQIGEELNYKVTFLGITLGTISIKTVDTANFSGKTAFVVNGVIKSNPGIPFASIHQILESNINSNALYVFKASASKKEEKDDWSYIQLLCNYENSELNISQWYNNQKKNEKIINTNKPINDGLGLFFFARNMSGTSKNVKIPTFMGMDTSTTRIDFTGKNESIKIDAVNYKIKTKLIKGSADWKGPYGLHGVFDGWFSDDASGVPIRAKMKVFIGSINIELVSWKRGGWQPPKAD